MRLPICNTCNKVMDLATDEISGSYSLDDGDNLGFTATEFTPEEAQIRVNRGDCRCGEPVRKNTVISPNQGKLFDF